MRAAGLGSGGFLEDQSSEAGLWGYRTAQALEGALNLLAQNRSTPPSCPCTDQAVSPAGTRPAPPRLPLPAPGQGGGDSGLRNWRGCREGSQTSCPQSDVCWAARSLLPHNSWTPGSLVPLRQPPIGGLCLGSNPSRERVSTGAKSWRVRWALQSLSSAHSPGCPSTPSRRHPPPDPPHLPRVSLHGYQRSLCRAGCGPGGGGRGLGGGWSQPRPRTLSPVVSTHHGSQGPSILSG